MASGNGVAGGVAAQAIPMDRRRQEDRTREMKHRLLRATGDVLIEAGYHGLTMAKVAAAARVSNGAALYHFGTKDALVEETGRDLARRITRAVFRIIREADPAADPVAEVMLKIWRQGLSAREGLVLTELLSASRSSPALHDLVVRLWTRLYRTLTRVGRGPVRQLGRTLPAERIILLSQWVLRGMAADAHLGAHPKVFEGYIRDWITLLRPDPVS